MQFHKTIIETRLKVGMASLQMIARQDVIGEKCSSSFTQTYKVSVIRIFRPVY